jgi:rhodanese-related sulfurtransferase
MRTALVALAVAVAAAALAPARATDPKAAEQAVAATGVVPGVVSGDAARKLVAAGIKVVDVRTPAEFADGHVPGAVNIPFDQMPQRFAELGPPSTPVLLYCRTGHRSGIASGTLKEKGFTRIYDLQAYDRWVASGR